VIGWFAHLDAVDHHVDIVFFRFLERGQFIKVAGCAVDAKAHVALRLHVGKHVQEFPFFLPRQRRQDHEPGAFRQGQHRVHHLAHGLGLQG
jgi:hypothetical protein